MKPKYWQKMTKPILIIHGMEDKATPLNRSQALHDLWKGSRLDIFQKAGHSPQEEYPMRFNRLAIRFLSEHMVSTGRSCGSCTEYTVHFYLDKKGDLNLRLKPIGHFVGCRSTNASIRA
jgi:hypothetical protein